MTAASFPLAIVPTPLHRLDRLAAALGMHDLFVKRDDLSGFAAAGNKARQLERLVGDALARGADVLVAGGGPASNFCAGAAAAAAVAGLGCTLVLFGTGGHHPNLSLARWFGAEVTFTGSDERASVDRAVEETAAALRADGRRPYVLPRGGATPVGAAGQALAFAEAATQLRALGVDAATVVVASGSGGTQAGLVCGAAGRRAQAGQIWKVAGASVSRPPQVCTARVLELSRRCAQLLESPLPGPTDVWVHDARGPGFAVPSTAGEEMATLAARTEGLLLDPTYTAKALGILPQLLADGLSGPVLFWHTGGTFGRLHAAAQTVALR